MGKKKRDSKVARACVLCGRSSGEVPLLRFEFRAEKRYVCAQHLPVLIHEPHRLVGVLEGAESLAPAEHRD